MKNAFARHLTLSSLLVLTAGLLPAAAGTSDAWLTTKIKIALLTTAGTYTRHVNVDSVHGSVTLHGKVETDQQRADAEEVARKVEGVKGFRSLLQVVAEDHELAVEADDKEIERRLQATLKQDRALAKSYIEVESVNHGVVLLGGQAASVSDHLRALELASLAPGVHEVTSEVKSPDLMSDSEIWRHQPGTHDASKLDASTVISDLWITSDVKMRLMADSAIPAMDINVDTRDGVVTLFGVVSSKESSLAAEAEANKAGGVHNVVNALEVVPKAKQEAVTARDEDLETELEKSLRADTELDDSAITVDVKNGVARLSGTVASENDRYLVMYKARSLSGVRSVLGELRVETTTTKPAK